MSTNAWLLEMGLSYKLSVGRRELLHLIDVPITFEVPYTPAYCHRVVSWQGRLLPVMDMAAWLGEPVQNSQFIAVVGYQKMRGDSPQFGAISLTSPPRQVSVDDTQACDLPGRYAGLSELAISCFDHMGEAVPVLNLNRLFDAAPGQKL